MSPEGKGLSAQECCAWESPVGTIVGRPAEEGQQHLKSPTSHVIADIAVIGDTKHQIAGKTQRLKPDVYRT